MSTIERKNQTCWDELIQPQQAQLVLDVLDAVHGYIKACDPCSFKSLLNEVRSQVIDHNLHIFWMTGLIDEALNRLIRSGQIEIETTFGSDSVPRVAFRQA